MMDNEPDDITLPTLPMSEPSLPLAPPFQGIIVRKRPFLRSREPSSHEDLLADALNTSSDPALFSSDDTPDAENYSSGGKRRKKKVYEGTWWGGRHNKARARRGDQLDDRHGKRQFRRNFDSGIFMGDDSSGTELSSGSLLEQALLEAQERRENDQIQRQTQTVNIPQATPAERPSTPRGQFSFGAEIELKRTPQTKAIGPKHRIVEDIIQECLRKNEQNVDLTGLDLDSLPTSITDLKSMIKRIVPNAGIAKLAPFEAKLMFFIGNNNFTQFPSAVLELTNVKVLSLRQNKLAELPVGIRSLVNLKVLNVSGNSLQYLPYEIMDLLRENKLKSIQLSPNPWVPLPSKEERLREVPLPQIFSKKLIHFNRVAVGKPTTRRFSDHAHRHSDSLHASNKQPSLSEVVLRALARHNPAKIDLSPLLHESDAPGPKDLLHTLHSVQLSGGRQCTFCKRAIVLPKFQWIEWWSIVPQPHQSTEVVDAGYKDEDGSDKPALVRLVYDDPSVEGSPLKTDDHEDSDQSLLPFLRMGCGCQTIREGLQTEANALLEWGAKIDDSVKTDIKTGSA